MWDKSSICRAWWKTCVFEPTDEPRGVYQIDLQVNFDSQVASINGHVDIHDVYDAFSFGDSQIQGDDIIAVEGHSGLTQTGLGQHEVFRIPMVATAAGEAGFAINELTELRIMRFAASVPTARANLTVEPLTVVAGSRWQNPVRPADTNADTAISPLDGAVGY